jgi:pimeloyl-ACP methyl ester carboxylesterase
MEDSPVSTTRQITVCYGHLSVRVQPGKSPALVFLHYWGGSHRTFDQVVANLSSGCTIVTYDQRGWGKSRDLPGPYGIDQLADDVLDVVRGLDLGPFVLIGHSMGGKVAQLVASQQPTGLRGVVLVAPAPPRPNVDTTSIERRSHAYDNVDTVSSALDHTLTHQPLHTDLRDQVLTDSLSAGSEATLSWPLHGMTEDITVAAGQITVPVLVLAGQHDKVDPPEDLKADLLPFIPHAQMTIIDKTGHLSPLEAPEQLAREIDQFITGLEESA